MAATIDYFFTLQSPWAYLGHAAFLAVAGEHGATVHHRPVSLGTVFGGTGGLPLGKRHPARQRYRIIELQRWREARGLPMTLHPRYWPVDATLADKAVIAAADEPGCDPGRLAGRLFAAVFEREENIADEAFLASVATEFGLDGRAVLSRAKDAETADRLAANTARALEIGAVGSPAYALNGEVFWGQDRIPLLDSALRSGRAPFRADA